MENVQTREYLEKDKEHSDISVGEEHDPIEELEAYPADNNRIHSAPIKMAGSALGASSPNENGVTGQSHIRQLQKSYGNLATLRLYNLNETLQLKNHTGQHPDPYEHEAEHFINQIGLENTQSHPLSSIPLKIQRASTGGNDQAGSETTPANDLIVEDSAAELSTGQMRKNEFLSLLRSEIRQTIVSALTGSFWLTAINSRLENYFLPYSNLQASQLERTIRINIPESVSVTNAREYIPFICSRVRQDITSRVMSGGMTRGIRGVVSNIASTGSSMIRGVGNTVSRLGSILFKSRRHGPKEEADPNTVRSQLSVGQPLESGIKSRMQSAFGYDFSHVRVHTESGDARISHNLNARAFTIGNDIAFDSGEYKPGSLVGDALIAHELAHVVQQDAGLSSPVPSRRAESRFFSDSTNTDSLSASKINYHTEQIRTNDTDSLERDADIATYHATAFNWGKGNFNIHGNHRPEKRQGLRLQRCVQGPVVAPAISQANALQETLEARSSAIDSEALSSFETARTLGLANDITGTCLSPQWLAGVDRDELEHLAEMAWQARSSAPENSLEREMIQGNLELIEQEFSRRGLQSANLTRHALHDVVREVLGSTRNIAGSLSTFAGSQHAIGSGGPHPLFLYHVRHGVESLAWVQNAISSALNHIETAAGVNQHDMALAVLRLAGPKAQAAMFGSILLTVWMDFINLADVVWKQGVFYSKEVLFQEIEGVWGMIQPTMQSLSSLQTDRVISAATSVPGLIQNLRNRFDEIRDAVQQAMERGGQIVMAAQIFEAICMVSTMRFAMPRVPPAAPFVINTGVMVMGRGGVMMGARIVVSAEWVEMMRRLVQAGVISVPVVTASIRAAAGQSMMSSANQELPPGVRERFGEDPTPEGSAVNVTGSRGAGTSAAERPHHHVMPKTKRAWFRRRGFRDDMDIDHFCVELDQAHHQAIHGGGNWRLGRTWPGEWNRRIMDVLRRRERLLGRRLTRNEILEIVGREMKRYDIPMNFVTWRGR